MSTSSNKLRYALIVLLLGAAAQPAAAGLYTDAVTQDAPLGYWRLGEAGGVTVFDQTGAHNGTADVGVLFGQPSLLPAEPGNTSITVNGTPRITVPAFEKFPGGSTGYSVEYWVKVNSSTGLFHNIVGDGEGGGDFYLMNYLTTTRNIRPHFNGAGTTSIDSTTALAVGSTYHVVTTWDKTTGLGSIYINGILNRQVNVGTGTPVNTNNPLFFGRDNREPGGNFTIDEVAVYDKPLSPYRIAAHAVAGGILSASRSVSLSTDVMGPGTFGDGYNNNATTSTVELVRFIANSDAAPLNVAYTQNPANTIDFSPWVRSGATGGIWGSDTHGRPPPGNLWIAGDGETNTPHTGFGAHANWFVTFDLNDIRAAHLGGFEHELVLAGRFGAWGSIGSTDPLAGVVQGAIFLDGQRIDTMPETTRTGPSIPFSMILPKSGRYLTLAILNGPASTLWDDGIFRDVTLSAVPEPSTGLLAALGGIGLALLGARRRRR